MIEAASESSYPYADTEAARMLRTALKRIQTEEGVSLRQLAKKLNYKQATVLSHMASGRITIPMRKAGEIAEITGISPSPFIIAVADQRQTDRFSLATSIDAGLFSIAVDGFFEELEMIAGVPLDQLTAEQKQVMREVAAQPDPTRRWLAPAEVPALQLLRKLRPEMAKSGIDQKDRISLKQALKR